jgi:hypothetical protein
VETDKQPTMMTKHVLMYTTRIEMNEKKKKTDKRKIKQKEKG